MFDIGWSELIIVALAALLIVGPKELPSLLRRLGAMAGSLRRQAQEFRQALEEMDQPRRPPRAKQKPYPDPEPAKSKPTKFKPTPPEEA